MTVEWPGGKRFAFTVFDDPDSQTLDDGRMVYDLLERLGLRTTKAVWPLAPVDGPSDHGGTCGDPAYREWCLYLQKQGFELALHGARPHTSQRAATAKGLEAFQQMFDSPPHIYANHYFNDESMYWGPARLTGWRRTVYTIATRGRNAYSAGHRPESRLFWGDLCHSHIGYVRNFVFREVNTLEACPWMPYHDPQKPFVRSWFAGSDGNNRDAFVRLLSGRNLDELERSGGACIAYTHFGHGFVRGGRPDPAFVRTIEDLASRDPWFVPVGTLLDFLASRPGHHENISTRSLARMERRWLLQKLLHGTS